MTLRAGSYAPEWRGVIRNDGWPEYECTHSHVVPHDARDCARQALPVIASSGILPRDWRHYSAEGGDNMTGPTSDPDADHLLTDDDTVDAPD